MRRTRVSATAVEAREVAVLDDIAFDLVRQIFCPLSEPFPRVVEKVAPLPEIGNVVAANVSDMRAFEEAVGQL